LGTTIKKKFSNLIPVIVPIFDGAEKLSPSMRSWITRNFPGLLDVFTAEPEKKTKKTAEPEKKAEM
jgi:hypothetical protein